MRKYLMPVVAVLLLASVSACGVKSAPQAPDGSSYPRQYPAEKKKSQLLPAGQPLLNAMKTG